MKRRWILGLSNVIVLVALVALTQCGSDDEDGDSGGLGEEKRASINITPQENPFDFETGTIEVNTQKSEMFGIQNTGNIDLEIKSIELVYEPENPTVESSEDKYAFQMALGGTLPAKVAPLTATSGETRFTFTVSYLNFGDELERDAQIVIKHNDSTQGNQTIIDLRALPGLPRIRINPEVVDMGMVSINETFEQQVTIQNVGSSDLIVDKFKFVGDNDNFGTTIGNSGSLMPDPISAEMAEGVVLNPPITIEPDGTYSFKITYTALNADSAEATMVLYSNDPQDSEKAIAVAANNAGACIAPQPPVVQFGGKAVGNTASLPIAINSCGDMPLEITSLEFLATDEDGNPYSGEFNLDLSDIGLGLLSEMDPPISEANPLVVPINQTITVTAIYIPDTESPKDTNGVYINDEAVLRIGSNAFTPTVDIPFFGFGVPMECPVAIISVEEGEEVIPQTKLHLVGDQSYSPMGAINKWEWKVTQPPGSQSVFVPSTSYPNPSFEANVAGEYVFTLSVWDEYGNKSCQDATTTVLVVPDEVIHVELLWYTPNDPDETDTGAFAGSDIDLHFTHPEAAQFDIDEDGVLDPWFDSQWDCFWYYATQNWGDYSDTDDDPSLDRDDTDGAGPENINLQVPEDQVSYSVGIHYWDDHGYGAAHATVRVYIYGLLTFEIPDVKLVNHDMWDVAKIDWPSGQVHLVTTPSGTYKITPDYQHPYYYQP